MHDRFLTTACLAALCAAGVASRSEAQQADGYTGAARASAYRASAGDMSFALTGDAIISRPLAVHEEPEFVRMIEAIRGAEAAFTNLEISLQSTDELVSMTTSGGSYMFAHPSMAKELAWAGFDGVGRPNNHTFDYGLDGMRATTRAVDAAGLAQAGVGENLAMAEAPAFVETRSGRVALIATASTFEDFQAAGPQLRDIRGNPGLNPLRFREIVQLPRAGFEQMQRMAQEFGQRPSGRDTMSLWGRTFAVGERSQMRTVLDAENALRLEKSIAAAKRQADWVVVTTHTHEGAGSRDIPAEFLVEYAHRAIDAGADVFFGTGPHVLRGIEIYKGKPIFYSLGNFLMENETVQFRPGSEVVRAADLQGDHTVDYYDARQKASSNGYFTKDPVYWESVVALPTFEAGMLKEIRLLPLSLGYQEPRSRRGRALLAGAEQGQQILARLAKMSEPFGTRIEIENGVGVIRPR